MPRSSNQKSKVLYVMKMLCEQTDEEHTLTVEQIIEGLEQYGISAERKSIYADIETLKNFGIDVESKREKHTGYYVASRDFELPELKLLVDAVQSSKFITEKKSRELIRKIERLTGKYEAQKLERQVNVADRIKHMNESIYYSVDQIHTAISENKKVSFRYFELNEKKERVMKRGGDAYTVSPYSLVWDDENYYLVGMDDLYGERRHYRVDKMSRLTVTDDERNMSCDAGESGSYSKKLFGMFGETEALLRKAMEDYEAKKFVAKSENATVGMLLDMEESQKSTASTGFCVIKVDFGNDGVIDKTYHTAQIGEDINVQGGIRNKLDFTITLNQSARITFISHWGTSSRYAEFKTITDSDGKTNYITDGATVVLGTLQYTPEGNNQDQQDTTEQDAEDAVSDETTDDITSDETTQNTTSTETESSESSDTTTSTPNEPSSQTPTPSETITPSDESAKENTEGNSSTETSDDKTSSTESDEKTTNDATNSANPDESNESFETEENIILSDNTEFNS